MTGYPQPELYKFSVNIIAFLTFYLSCQPRSGHRRKSWWYFLDKISRKFSHFVRDLNRIEYWLDPCSKQVLLKLTRVHYNLYEIWWILFWGEIITFPIILDKLVPSWISGSWRKFWKNVQVFCQSGLDAKYSELIVQNYF